MPKLEQFEIKKYWQIFSGLTPQDNKVTHDQVLPILLNSKLDSSILNKIWFLADIDDDDNLDFEEFVICMRLIFDMVNRNIDSVPDELPDWLIPGSKANLVAQRRSTKASSDSDKGTSGEESGPGVEWYISPSDKSRYEGLYERCRATTDGAVSLASLRPVVLSELSNVTPKELDHVWKLVNAKNLSVIDKDPVIYLLHILKQRNDLRAKIPDDVPPALKEVFGKEKVSTDLNNNQGSIRSGSKGPATGSQYSSSNAGQKASTESSYPATKGSDWEIVKLQRDLVDLDKEIADIERKKSEVQKSRPQLLLSQFEELYRYKKEQTSKPMVTPSSLNVMGLRDDIDSLEMQVQVLQQYLNNKQDELRQLQQQVEAFK